MNYPITCTIFKVHTAPISHLTPMWAKRSYPLSCCRICPSRLTHRPGWVGSAQMWAISFSGDSTWLQQPNFLTMPIVECPNERYASRSQKCTHNLAKPFPGPQEPASTLHRSVRQHTAVITNKMVLPSLIFSFQVFTQEFYLFPVCFFCWSKTEKNILHFALMELLEYIRNILCMWNIMLSWELLTNT